MNRTNKFSDSAGSAVTSAMDAVENTQVCTSCLICGDAVPVYGFRYEPKICNECKKAVLAMRKGVGTVISIEFSEDEYNKIRQYQEKVCADSVQEAIMDAVSVNSMDDILCLACRIEDRKKKGATAP